MGRNLVETLIGAAVLVVAVVFIAYAYNRSNVATVEGYEVFARFSSVEGLKVGDDVRISGIKVGSIIDQSLDPGFFQAVVRMSIEPSVELPEDTTAAVTSEGLLGGKFLALDPGGADELIPPGGEIKITQSSINIEGLIGKFIYGAGGGKAE
ncbi:MAG: outer membrane lipid asymmetry maintenance protein MlaD [Proteobacteria bacterium]|nr:outer membrane lipid asymmetry maintenance protein MlaD [Pseudomonadota bacterium]